LQGLLPTRSTGGSGLKSATNSNWSRPAVPIVSVGVAQPVG